MAFDWKQLERDDQSRDRRVLLTFGATWTIVGVVGTLILLATGHQERLAYQAIWLTIGVVTLILGLVAKSRSSGSSRDGSDELQ